MANYNKPSIKFALHEPLEEFAAANLPTPPFASTGDLSPEDD